MKTIADTPPPPSKPRLLAAAEVIIIFLLLFVFAGTPPPGNDEVYYLGKAKQYWDAPWLAGDFFLETPDAHVVFNWTIGWLTQYFSLDAVAWIGRCAAWLLLAIAWRRLSWALVPLPFASLLSMALFLVFQQYGTAAREWIVGGVEAKCFAYVFVILALEQLVRGRWRFVWPLLGIAAAFHVLVGGWAVVAALLTWIATKERPSFVSMLPWLVLGGLFSLPGLIPALMLTWNADPEVVRQANESYVFYRLNHHLLVYDFPLRYKLQFLAVLSVWLIVCYLTRGDASRLPLRRFVLASVVIGIAGIIVDQATMRWPDLAASLLRYYWYRLPDMMVPLGLAFALVEAYATWRKTDVSSAQAYLVVLCLVPMAVLTFHCGWQLSDGRPTADVQGHIGDDDPREYEDWRLTCEWIRENTPPDARFLIPPNAMSFRWYAQRSEVVSWKDIPQDAAGIVEWRRRCDATQRWWEQLRKAGRMTPQINRRLGELAAADEFDFQYIVAARRHGAGRLPLPEEFATAHFVVYRVK